MTDVSDSVLREYADKFASGICEKIEKEPANLTMHARELAELKPQLAETAAQIAAGDKLSRIENEKELIWTLAPELPDFDTDTLYRKKQSIQSLAMAVFLGWILGGLLSGVLSFLSLGGDILRALTIFVAVWASQYLTSNPGARRILLACLGLGGLARFAGMAASGLIRFGQFSSWRSIIFGAGKSVNIFKSVWLLGGALFVFTFFSRKIDGLDIPAFSASLSSQIAQELKLLTSFFALVNQKDTALAELRRDMNDGKLEKLLRGQGEIVDAIIELRPSLNDDQRKYIDQKLVQGGIELPPDDLIIWNEAEHSPLYDTIGLIKNGDRAKILRPAKVWNGEITKGFIQRVN